MKKQLESALEHAREYYKLYTDLPIASGWFGTSVIMKLIARAEKMLEDFDNQKASEVESLIEELNNIE